MVFKRHPTRFPWQTGYQSPWHDWDEAEPQVAYGFRRRAVRRLRDVHSPVRVAAFKRAFPGAFEEVKHDLGGGMLTASMAKALIRDYGLTWIITQAIWTGAQRITAHDNNILIFNIDARLLTEDTDDLTRLEALGDCIRESSHSFLQRGPWYLIPIGWVRVAYFMRPWAKPATGNILIEEIQSDVLRKYNYLERVFKLTHQFDVLKEFVDRFYADALALILDIAEDSGARVEMLTFKDKGGYGHAPRYVYEKLPKRLGMRKTTDVESPAKVKEVWAFQPNSRRSRLHLPDVFLWRKT
jgi:hypothetical protein